ncbi:MAG: hypothetical protein WA902_21875 [Thermosynechococcaceae cyanobacterium]
MTTSDIDQIFALVQAASLGLSRGQIKAQLSFSIPDKTLQRRLATLVRQGKVKKEGITSSTKYYSVNEPSVSALYPEANVFRQENQERLQYLDLPIYARKRVTYNKDLLDDYSANQTFYLPEATRAELYENGKRLDTAMAAGTYARQILNRLLIDLSYNSSRLEGNTYSKLDTLKLIENNISAEGKVPEETVMIMNHREAISFLVDNARDIGVTPFSEFVIGNSVKPVLVTSLEKGYMDNKQRA